MSPSPSPSPSPVKKFIDKHSAHGWQQVATASDLEFPNITDTHVEFVCPCNPGYHFTVHRRALNNPITSPP